MLHKETVSHKNKQNETKQKTPTVLDVSSVVDCMCASMPYVLDFILTLPTCHTSKKRRKEKGMYSWFSIKHTFLALRKFLYTKRWALLSVQLLLQEFYPGNGETHSQLLRENGKIHLDNVHNVWGSAQECSIKEKFLKKSSMIVARRNHHQLTLGWLQEIRSDC